MLILILFYPYNVLPSAVFANVQCTVYFCQSLVSVVLKRLNLGWWGFTTE